MNERKSQVIRPDIDHVFFLDRADAGRYFDQIQSLMEKIEGITGQPYLLAPLTDIADSTPEEDDNERDDSTDDDGDSKRRSKPRK